MKAIGFDLGGTLINYNGIPMSWQKLYSSALTDVALRCNCSIRLRENSLKTENTNCDLSYFIL